MILSEQHIDTIQGNSVTHIIQVIEQNGPDGMFIQIGKRDTIHTIGFGVQRADGVWLATATLDPREDDRPTWRTADWRGQNGVIRAVNPWDGFKVRQEAVDFVRSTAAAFYAEKGTPMHRESIA